MIKGFDDVTNELVCSGDVTHVIHGNENTSVSLVVHP